MESKSPVIAEVLDLVAERLGIERSDLRADSCADDFPEKWDSIGTVAVLLAIDKAFGTRIEPGSAGKLTSVQGILSLVRERGAV